MVFRNLLINLFECFISPWLNLHALSCLILNVALEDFITDKITTNSIICNKSVQILAYTDDLHVMGWSKEAVTEDFAAVHTEPEKMRQSINKEKIKVMIVSKQPADHPHELWMVLHLRMWPSLNILQQLSPGEMKWMLNRITD